MKIEFLPEAKAELDEAIAYYELQLEGLGGAFLRVLQNLRLEEWQHFQPLGQ